MYKVNGMNIKKKKKKGKPVLGRNKGTNMTSFTQLINISPKSNQRH